MTVKEYIEEFYRFKIITGQRERDDENFSRYMNGMRYGIHDDLSMMSINTVEDAYEFSLKVEENLDRKQSQ
jgi:hypothetical protein